MRFLPILLIASALGSCNTAPPVQSAEQVARGQARFAELTAGKVAGTPVSCLPHRSSRNQITLPGGTIAFRDSSRVVYVNTMQCPQMRDSYALVTRPVGTTSLCRGDIAQVMDPANGVFVGSCVFGDFVPYTSAGG